MPPPFTTAPPRKTVHQTRRAPGQPQLGENAVAYAMRTSQEVAPTSARRAAPDAFPAAAGLRDWQRAVAAQSLRSGDVRSDRSAEREERQARRSREAMRVQRQINEPPEYTGPTSMDLNEIPQALNPMLRSPRRGVGLIQWNVDGRRPVQDIFADVARVTGAPQELLWAMSARESAGDQRAKNRGPHNPDGTSATGPFQFVDGTWRQYARGALPIYGLPPGMSDAEVMWHREDWAMSAGAAAELARSNHASLQAATPNRNITIADLYIVHFGGGAGINLVRALENGNTQGKAAEFFSPDAIARNRREFYAPNGRAYTVREFYDMMTGERAREDGIWHRPMPREEARFQPRLDGSTFHFVERGGRLVRSDAVQSAGAQ